MEALALLELESIAIGCRTADELVKRARVDVLEARPLDPGKYLILFRGDVASVESAWGRGREVAGDRLVDEVFLPAVHESIVPILRGEPVEENEIDALGILETAATASIVRAADAAAKAAPVRLLRIHLARRIGGKGYLVLTGTLADVEAAVAAGSSAAGERGALVEAVVLPSPAPEVRGRIPGEWL